VPGNKATRKVDAMVAFVEAAVRHETYRGRHLGRLDGFQGLLDVKALLMVKFLLSALPVWLGLPAS
jgi:hypothetical protein